MSCSRAGYSDELSRARLKHRPTSGRCTSSAVASRRITSKPPLGFVKPAEQGHAGAANLLGERYDLGEGVPQDYVEAVTWYRLAAEQASSQRSLNSG